VGSSPTLGTNDKYVQLGRFNNNGQVLTLR
jgi:hypothetical protein